MNDCRARKNKERSFDVKQREVLGKYVYGLTDPRDGYLFYVGQGVGERLFDHLHDAEASVMSHRRSNKIQRIIDIWNSGNDVQWHIFAHSLSDEAADYVESSIIDALGCSLNGLSLNEKKGPKSTSLSASTVKSIGAKKIDPTIPYERVFVLPVHNGLASTPGDVYEAVRKAWGVSQGHRDGLSFAVAIKDNISIGCFKIDKWDHQWGNKYAFEGSECPDLINFNWQKIISGAMGYWQFGNYLIVEFDGEGKYRYLYGNSDKEWRSAA